MKELNGRLLLNEEKQNGKRPLPSETLTTSPYSIGYEKVCKTYGMDSEPITMVERGKAMKEHNQVKTFIALQTLIIVVALGLCTAMSSFVLAKLQTAPADVYVLISREVVPRVTKLETTQHEILDRIQHLEEGN